MIKKTILNTPILIDYYFEKEQPLLIEIKIIEKHIPIEFQIKTTLDCIIGSKKKTFSIKISSPDNEILILEAEKYEKTEEVINIKFEIKTNRRYIVLDILKYKMYYEIHSDKILYRSECLNDKGIIK